MNEVPHNRPWVTEVDISAVNSTLASGWLAQGAEVSRLEAYFNVALGSDGACALSSGTAALFLSLRAMGAGKGDNVVVPTYACSALLNAVYMTGATPYISDVNAEDFCIDPECVRINGRHAQFVIAVHMYGAPAKIDSLKAMGKLVVEDCCQALGGFDEDNPVGTAGDISVFSFYATKIVTGGQGGLVWSKNPLFIEKAFDYRQFDCRKTYTPSFNLQMTDIQAALINSQLKRLGVIHERRLSIAQRYLSALPTGLRVQSGLKKKGRMAYRFVVIAPDIDVRESLRIHLGAAGIKCIVPVEKYELLHRYLNLDPAAFPVAERLANCTLSLPLYPSLTDSEVERICKSLQRFEG